MLRYNHSFCLRHPLWHLACSWISFVWPCGVLVMLGMIRTYIFVHVSMGSYRYSVFGKVHSFFQMVGRCRNWLFPSTPISCLVDLQFICFLSYMSHIFCKVLRPGPFLCYLYFYVQPFITGSPFTYLQTWLELSINFQLGNYIVWHIDKH